MGGSGSKPKESVGPPQDPPPDDGEDTNSKYGKPRKYDPTFNGPIKNRGCTDVLCCLLFFLCVLGAAGVTVLAIMRGDPKKLLYPTDSDGNICGYGEYVDKPNLFFFDLLGCAMKGLKVTLSGCPTPQVCLKECPSDKWAWATLYATEKGQALVGDVDKSGRSSMICKYGIDALTSTKSVLQLVADEDCAAYYVESTPVVGRCIPAIATELVNKANELLNNHNETILDRLNNTITKTQLDTGSKGLALLLNAMEYGMKVYQDVRATWWMMLIALVIAMILSFLWIILMRWIADIVVWITIILFVGIFSFTTYYTFNRYVTMKDNPLHQIQGSIEFTIDLDYYWNLARTWLVLGIASAVILGVTLLLLIFLRKRILIAIAIIKAASRAVGAMIFTLFWPMIPFVLEFALFFWWGVAAIYLASSGKAEYSATNTTKKKKVPTATLR